MTTNMLLRVGAVGLLLLLQSGTVVAFQAATTTSTAPPAKTTSLSDDISTQQQQRSPAHTHEFWRKERSHQEVKAHVTQCLAEIDEQHFCSSASSTRSNNNDCNYKRQEQVQVLSAEPPLVLIHDVLTPQMCRDLIQTAKTANGGIMAPSRTGAEQNLSQSRTSTTVWLSDREATDSGRLIAEVVSSITGLPPNCQENLQVARYEPGQQFQLHTDHQDSFNDLERRGRLATFLIYLDAPEQGGATHFPGVNDDNNNDNDDECGTGDVCVPPLAGSAVFFFNTVEKPGCDDYDAEMFLHADLRMRHAGLPVEQGEKWICNRWVHPIEFGAGVRGLSAPSSTTS